VQLRPMAVARRNERSVRPRRSYANLATGGGYTCQVGENPPTPVKVGDYVQWTSNGVDQFKPARKVTKVENDHVWVFGSNTAIPMEQVTVSDPPALKSIIVEPSDRDDGPSDDVPQIDVLLRGNRLQITADVDAAGLQTLKEMIGKYEEILKLVSPKK
jgi:hypothetical protein